MVIEVKSPSGNRTWRLEPFDNGLCWRLMKTPMKKDAKSEWVNCECYTPTLEAGLKAMVQRILRDPDDPCKWEFTAEEIEKQAMRVLRDWLKKVEVSINDADADSASAAGSGADATGQQ